MSSSLLPCSAVERDQRSSSSNSLSKNRANWSCLVSGTARKRSMACSMSRVIDNSISPNRVVFPSRNFSAWFVLFN